MRSGFSVAGLLAIAVWGCSPPEPVEIVPPGVEVPPPRTGNDADAAVALGEQRANPTNPAGNATTKDGPKPQPATPVTGVFESDRELPPLAEPTKVGEEKTTKSGLKYETLREGQGPSVKAGTNVVVQYTGKFPDGDVFDTSRKPGRDPFSFTIGAGNVIAGWDEGVAGMKVGELRKLIVPPELGYGAGGNGRIPPNSTLEFEIELMQVR